MKIRGRRGESFHIETILLLSDQTLPEVAYSAVQIMMARLLLPALLASALVSSSFGDSTTAAGDCGPVEGVCQVTLTSLVEVSFYDINDPYGCQIECEVTAACNYYTEMPDPYDETLKKCLLFETCNLIDPCDTCTTCGL